MLLVTIFALTTAEFEMPALNHPSLYLIMTTVLVALALGLFVFNHHRAKSAIIYFEELPPELITTLGLVWVQPSPSPSPSPSPTPTRRNRLTPSRQPN